jgi:glyoxylase-like metal-dependent hydrolase (beta-lactamase superfamily II)
VAFYHGHDEVAPGLQLLHIGGHTRGLQAVRVHTARGWMVLASDASHYYDNMGLDAPFPIVDNVADMLAGYEILLKFAESPDHIVPGHDPLVRTRYPGLAGADTEVVALHLGNGARP